MNELTTSVARGSENTVSCLLRKKQQTYNKVEMYGGRLPFGPAKEVVGLVEETTSSIACKEQSLLILGTLLDTSTVL